MSRLLACAVISLVFATPTLAQQRSSADKTSTGPDIVVVGMSLKDAKAALAACIARHCPPDQDIQATLAIVETEFVSGDYLDARATALKSIGRNKRFAATYPVPVSNLLRAHSRIAAHLGEQEAYFGGALDVLDALKKGLPDTDGRILGARIEVGDAYAKTGQLTEAVETYRRVARRAGELRLSKVQGYALLRVAAVYAAASDVRNDANFIASLDAADRLIADPDPALAPFAKAAKLLKLKLAVRTGDSTAIDRLLAEYRDTGKGTAVPVLLYAPNIDLGERAIDANHGGETLSRILLDDVDGQWVDIGFEVQPDGKVTDVGVLRQSATLAGRWTKPILTAIAGRRYAPLTADSPSALRIERYTFTAAWTTVTGTHLRVRSPVPHLESVDLSRDPAGAK